MVAATNIREKLSDWSCVNGVIESSVCSGTPWTGVGCDFNNMIASITLSSQQLKGTLPSSLAGLGSLSMLSLGYNSLSGTIPSSYGILGSLQLLDLQHNSLQGVIPLSFLHLCELKVLDLAYNKLFGIIPALYIKPLYKLVLENNGFTGTISDSLYAIQFLFLSNNHISGSIAIPPPPDPTNIVVLNVMNNNLLGIVPSSLCSVHSLEMIDVSGNNNLTCYPPCLTNIVRHTFGSIQKCSSGKCFNKFHLYLYY